jgi:hypothetical protein
VRWSQTVIGSRKSPPNNDRYMLFLERCGNDQSMDHVVTLDSTTSARPANELSQALPRPHVVRRGCQCNLHRPIRHRGDCAQLHHSTGVERVTFSCRNTQQCTWIYRLISRFVSTRLRGPLSVPPLSSQATTSSSRPTIFRYEVAGYIKILSIGT